LRNADRSPHGKGGAGLQACVGKEELNGLQPLRLTEVTKKDDTHAITSDQRWVLASLEPDQLSMAKKHAIPRRRLKGPELLILWALRLYLLFMMAVVAYQVWITRAYH
jgi:hypothetical protein